MNEKHHHAQNNQQRDRTNTVYYDAQSNFGTPPTNEKMTSSSGGIPSGDYKDYKMGIRKASGGSVAADEMLYERVHTERRHHSSSSSSPYPPHRPQSREAAYRNPSTQSTVIHHQIRSPSTSGPHVIMAPMSSSYDYSIGSSAGFRNSSEERRYPPSLSQAHQSHKPKEDFRPGPRASSAANIDALFAPRSMSSSSGSASRMNAGGMGYDPPYSRSTKPSPLRNHQDPSKDYSVVGAYSSSSQQATPTSHHGVMRQATPTRSGNVRQHSQDYELDPRLNVTYPQFYVDDWKERHHHHQNVTSSSASGGYPRGNGVPRQSPSFTTTATVTPSQYTVQGAGGGRPRFASDAAVNRHLNEEVPMGGNNGYRSPAAYGMKETAILDDYDNVPSEFLDENLRRKNTKEDSSTKDDGSIYQAGRYQPSEDAGSSSDEDDPEYLELLERDSIINRYEKGPDAADVDAWENPDFELYDNLDRFGFVHKKGDKTDERTDAQKRRIIKELSREKKWLKMIEALKSGPPTKKMEDRIWKGIPEKLRIVIWPRLLDAERKKHEKRDMYSELLLRARLVSKDIKQIDLDINRTYRDHLAFRKRYDVKQKSLLNVLAAYSMYNTEVGYCQGMSQIAALFLMYLDEEDAFWCLHQLMVSPNHTMHGFFVPGFPKLQRFEEHFKKVLKKYKPRIYKYLEKQDIPYIYLTKWWFGCFLDRVPFSLALRLWDVFLVEGDCILIAMAFNIMKMHEKSIRKHTMESFMEFIQNDIAQNFGYSDDEVMYSLRETLTKLKSDRQHIPPPPRPEDLSEVPTKALGPILNKPMASIREEIHEIQSRRSRANSTGRSPHPKRKESGRGGVSKGPPPVTHKWNGNASQDSIIGNGREVPFEIPTRRVAGSPASSDAYISPPPHNNGALPPSGSSKRDITTPTTRNYSTPQQQQNYSNPNPSSRGGTPSMQRLRDERNGQMVILSRASDSDNDGVSPTINNRDPPTDWTPPTHISTATSRITHQRNNITRIELDDDVSVI